MMFVDKGEHCTQQIACLVLCYAFTVLNQSSYALSRSGSLLLEIRICLYFILIKYYYILGNRSMYVIRKYLGQVLAKIITAGVVGLVMLSVETGRSEIFFFNCPSGLYCIMA